MDFEHNNILYFVHHYYRNDYKVANYVYFKDGDIVFIDYSSNTLKETIELFKKIHSF